MKRTLKHLLLLFIFVFAVSIFGVENVFASSKIKLTGIEIADRSSTIDASISDFSSDSVVTDIAYHKYNDFVTFRLTIHNDDSRDYIIKSITDNNSNSYLDYEYDSYENTVLKANSDVQILIRSKYVTELTDLDQRDQNSSVKFTINFVDEKGEDVNVDIDVNPLTSDSIYLYIEVLGVSVILLLLVLIVKAKSYKSRLRKLFLMVIVYILMTPAMLKALEIGTTITFNNTIKLEDKVKVTYKIGDESNTVTIDYNSKAEDKAIPDKDGYRTDGWYKGETQFDFATNVTEDIELVAKYTKIRYNITYDLGGGNATNPSVYYTTGLPIVLNNPQKNGYDFIGWTDIDGNTTNPTIIQNEARDLHFVAKYQIKEYDINYDDLTDDELSTLNNPTSYTINDTITLNNPANRNDEDGDLTLKFVGWKNDAGDISKTVKIQNSTEDKNYEATWVHVNPDTYTIVYELNGGTLNGNTNPNTYTKITETFTLNNPELSGYMFMGWTGSNGTTPQKVVKVEQGTKGNLEFNAVFDEYTYEIHYDLDGGDVTGGTNPETYKVTQEITLIKPERRGYRFTGWTGTGLSGLTQDVTIPVGSTGDRSYTANWELETYQIHYTMNGGTITSGSNQTEYTVLDTFTLINPTLEGHIFDGWTGSNGTTPQLEVTITDEVGELNFEANFSANNYTIIFNKNNTAATGSMDPEPMTYDVAKALTKNAFEYEKHRFVGWTLNAEGTGTVYADEELVSNLALEGNVNLYAQWEEIMVAHFINGSEVKTRMVNLAGNASNIYKIKYYEGTVPSEYQTATYRVSNSSKSDKPIYLWYESSTNTIYYGSEADVLYLAPNCTSMFEGLTNVTEIDTHFDTKYVTDMTKMFYRCLKLETMDISHFNTSNVKNLTSMFSECNSFNQFDFTNWDVRNVTNFNFMFNQCYAPTILDLTSFYTNSAKSYNHMFSSMTHVKTILIPNFYSDNVTDMASMFDDNNSLENIDITHLNTSKVTTFKQFLKNTWALTNVDLTKLNTSSAKNMDKMFYHATALEELDLSNFDTSKVNSFDNMFSGMTSLKKIYVSTFATTGSTSNQIMFDGDTLLVGQEGSTYNSSRTRKQYARIDGGEGAEGYFWYKAKPTN